MPVGGTIDVFLVSPRTARAAVADLGAVPIVGVHRGVGRVGLVNNLEFDFQISRLAVEGVHAGVGHGHVERAGTLANDAKESVDGVHRQPGHSQVTVVHFDNRHGVVLTLPTEVVTPATEVELGVSDHQVGGGVGCTLQLANGHGRGAAPGGVGQWTHVTPVAVREGDLDGGGEGEEEVGGAATGRVRGVHLIGDGGVDEIGLVVTVEILHSDGPRDVGAKVRCLRVPEGSLRRGGLVGDVLEVAVHHGDGVDVARTCHISDGEVLRERQAKLDDRGVGCRDVGRIGPGGAGNAGAGELHNGHVVAVAGVGHLAGRIVEPFSAEQEDVIVRAGVANADALGFAVVTDLNGAVGVARGRAEERGEALGGTGDGAAVTDDVLASDVGFQFKDVNVVVAVLVGVTDGHVPHPEVGETLADGPVLVVAAIVFNDGQVAGFTGRCTCVVGLERVVLLVNRNVRSVVAGEFTDFDLFDVSKLVPVSVAAGVASDPDVLSLTEIAVAVVPEDGDAVRAVRGDGHVVGTVAVEVTDGDIGRITVGRVGSSHRCAGGRGQGERGAEHHQGSKEYAADSCFREVALSLHGHHCFAQVLLQYNAFVLRFHGTGTQPHETAKMQPEKLPNFPFKYGRRATSVMDPNRWHHRREF